MQRTNRDNAICFENLEEALAKSPETYGHLDLLCAGWPCQDNSIAGKRKGMQGKRSSLWSEVRRLIGIFYPKWLMLENVPGLFSVNNGKDFWQIISDLDSLGYCVAWDVLDSQNFGVAQRRKRVFIIGSFGNIGASKILFEPKGSSRNDKAKQKMGARGLCISTRDGERNDPTNETIIASTIGTSTNPDPNYGTHFIAQTIGASPRGNTSFVWQDTYIAETNSHRKREITGITRQLDSRRGIVIGNAVTVQVAQWLAKRIIDYERGLL